MLAQIGYYSILGKPLVFYLGYATLTSFLFTATVGYLNHTGRPVIPFKWHPRLAVLSITLALIHGLLASSIYFGI